MNLHTFALPVFIPIAALATIALGCDTLDPVDSVNPPRSLTQDEAAIVKADNAFGLTLFRRLHADAPDDNLFISPLSVSMALGMTLNGADGETREQMAAALFKEGLSEEAINSAYRSLIDLLSGLDPKVIMNIANSIWYREGFEVQPAFLDVNRDNFDAEVRELDFSSRDAVKTVNRWVDDKTEGLIDEIIDEIGVDVVMLLINAIYFKGQWTYEFDPELTSDQPFFNADGSNKTVPMMALEGSVPYAYTETASIIDLPYGDSLYSMMVVLPHETDALDSLAGQLNDETWSDWTSSLRLSNLTVNLPRFSIEYEKSLKEILPAMGMQDAFDSGRANFSRISATQPLYISDVLHKTVLKVNEEGSEAAAVTVVVVSRSSVNDPLVFRADRPFILAIRERSSGTILFVGKVMHL